MSDDFVEAMGLMLLLNFLHISLMCCNLPWLIIVLTFLSMIFGSFTVLMGEVSSIGSALGVLFSFAAFVCGFVNAAKLPISFQTGFVFFSFSVFISVFGIAFLKSILKIKRTVPFRFTLLVFVLVLALHFFTPQERMLSNRAPLKL